MLCKALFCNIIKYARLDSKRSITPAYAFLQCIVNIHSYSVGENAMVQKALVTYENIEINK